MTEQSISHNREKLQTVSRQDMTQELATCGQTETVLLNYNRIDKKTNVAKTLCARDYKGFETRFDTMNGVIKWSEK